MTSDSQELSSERLALLYRASQAFNSSLDLDEVLNRVMDEVIAATRAEQGFVMLREPDGSLGFRVARGMERKTIDEPQFQVSRSVMERVVREGRPILTSNAQADDRFSMRQSVMDLALRSILCVPLMIREHVSGVVYVENRMQTGIFTPADRDLLTAIASSASIAIENARLYQVAVEKGRMERELQMARDVQASMLPRQVPQVVGWDFVARWRPARQVSGDFYDFVPCEGGKIGLVIADVSDKGMPAALFMGLSRTIVRASVVGAASPGEGINRANRLICADADSGMFVTLFCAVLDPVDGEVTYVNAGHNPPLISRAGQDQLTELRATGLPLGIEADAVFEQRRFTLMPGDLVLFYTDGVTDATDPDVEEFGMERLRSVLLGHRHGSATQLADALEEAIDAFIGSTAQYDDIATLVAKRL
jgi:sigma-B regulation protein RsbU (phosphoserine phosphatase)